MITTGLIECASILTFANEHTKVTDAEVIVAASDCRHKPSKSNF